MRVRATDPEGKIYATYLNGARVPTAVEADTDKGYVVVFDRNKGTWSQDFMGHIRKLQGKVELVNIETGQVIT